MGKALDGLLERSGGLLYVPIPRVRRPKPKMSFADAYGGDLRQIGGALLEAILRPMESAGKQIAGDAPVDPNAITDAALASMGLGYGVTSMFGGVPKGALTAGGAGRGLPMDEASRMARADKQFPIEAYHGTNRDVGEFKERGTSTDAKSAKMAHWFTDNADTATGYADLAGTNEVQRIMNRSVEAEMRKDWDEVHRLTVDAEKLDATTGKGENILPVRLKGDFKEIDMDGVKYDPDDVHLSEILEEAADEGFDGVKLTNFSDEAGYGVYRPATHYAVFDAKNIRSRHAKFDPAKKDSANILASGGNPILSGLIAANNEGILGD